MLNKALRLFIYFSFAVITVRAQNLTKSPYSFYGVGDLQFGGNALQSALGQTTQGMRRVSEINNQNPASYGSLKLTVIEAGFKFSSGTISNTTSDNTIYNSSFGYLGIGLPISQKLRWGMSFGLQPYSSVGYNVAYYQLNGTLPDTFQTTFQTSGRGGISRFYFGTGIALFKDLSIGFNVSYLWGELATNKSIYIDPQHNKYNTEEVSKTYLGDLYFDYGIQYHKLFKNKLKEDKYKLTIGTTVNLATKLNATRDYSARTMGVGGILGTKDTVVYDGNKKSTLDLPFMLKGGFSFEEIDHWMVSADVNYAQWSTYRFFGSSDSLKNTLGVSVGASFIPNNTDYKNYFKRIEYRAGGRYDNGYLTINGQDIFTYGVSAGLGLPLGRNRSRLNLTAEYFVRGTSKNDLIREQYFRFILGVTFGDRWFVRYKYD